MKNQGNRGKSNKNLLRGGILIVILLFLCLVYYFLNVRPNTTSAPVGQNTGIQGECPQGWSFYKNNTVGISFCYPKEWGAVKNTDPAGQMTNLEEFANSGVLNGKNVGVFGYSFSVGFENGGANLRFFGNNEVHTDEIGTTYDKDTNRSLTSLLYSSDNICDYKIDNQSYKEYYGNCNNNVKTAFFNIINLDSSASDLPNGSLRSFGYKKLQNGYFDNLLISFIHGERKMHFPNSYNSIDDVLSAIEKDKKDFEKEKARFVTFLESIKTFAPIPYQKEAFKDISGEDPRITAIRKYYWLISNGKFDKAYAMEAADGKESYEKFTGQYEDIYNMVPHDFKNLGGDDFYFYADREYNNSPISKCGVRASVTEGKIKISLIETYLSQEIKSGNYTAFTAMRDGKIYIVLKDGDKELMVTSTGRDRGDALYNAYTSYFSSLEEATPDLSQLGNPDRIKFSPKLNYLSYVVEGANTTRENGFLEANVYDVKNLKTIFKKDVGDYSLTFDFTADEKSLYICTEPDYSGKLAGEVYSVPRFQQVFDAFSGVNLAYQNVKCEYKQDKDAIIFTLTNPSKEGLPDSKDVQY